MIVSGAYSLRVCPAFLLFILEIVILSKLHKLYKNLGGFLNGK